MLETYKKALIKYNTMLLENEPLENIEGQIKYIERLENEISENLKQF